MTIQYAILGFLSWKPLTGYELKKLFVDSPTLHWSGNNNQIYKTLIDLHKRGLVTQEIQHQDDHPSRKIYTITRSGREALHEWVLSPPELPQIRHVFLVQLAWADQLSAQELETLIARYEEEIRMQLLIVQAQAERDAHTPRRTERERYLWQMIARNQVSMYENELRWIHELREGLQEQPRTP